MSLTYQQSVDQLLSLADFERKARANESPDFHIRRTEMLLERLGNPHRTTPAVHVAGSKGKGSTCAMIAAALTANGLKTGMFVSPHLHRMTERFTIDGEPIAPGEFAALFERIWPEAEAIRLQGDCGTVSVFEFQTAMAFLHFAESRADAMVIEVGLGGRLDSTNVIEPVVSVITPVGLDHVAVLGETIEKIAAEKAGIIKPGVPVVMSLQSPSAENVIRDRALAQHAELIEASSVRTASVNPNGAGPQLIQMNSDVALYAIRLPLLGEHQVHNLASAIAAVEVFGRNSRKIEPSLTAHGLSRVHWPGRVQLIEHGPPPLIVDGAHNEDSAVALRAAIERHFGVPGRLVMVLGSTGGHDPLAVANAFSDLEPIVIVTQSRHPKAVERHDFAAALRQDKIQVDAVTATTSEALAEARRTANGSGMIVAAGSLFVAAEVIEAVGGHEPEIYPDLRGTVGPVRLDPGFKATTPPR